MSTSITHRQRPARGALLKVGALLTVGALALGACGGDRGAAGPADTDTTAAEEGEDVTIRFSWWGSDTRHEVTQEVLDLFMAENPDITVVGDFTDWGGYWDKLSTTVAAGDAPDVITQEERYLADYASRGVLADLSTLDIDTAEVDPGVVASGEVDGGLYGIATGINAYAVVADPQIFADAGVEMPDDTTWTWDDYVEIASEISASGEDVFGAQDYGFNEPGFAIWARQQGQNLYTPEGTLGYDEQTLADWWQTSLDLQDSGGTPDAARSVEIDAGGPEQSLLGTNTGAMGVWWTNQLGAISAAAGRDLELLRFPGESEHERTGMYFKPAMYYSVAETSQHPEAAAKLVDFLLNDPAAGELMLSDRGMPANTSVRDGIQELLPPVEQQAAAFLEDLEDEIVDGAPVPPVGAGEVVEIIRRINTEVLFGRLSPQEAAAQFTAEVEAATGS
ncbi:ABC transporter substrate-binding protein [Oerskovia flava]|uniref:ABC transporter substrate-binding protein n=1 Tax=Oerskovia flava TaxID=2986422 RepID=UPI00223F4677|nr:extracellular solute-binding protein [Oerskovia sp. JB1-3-2]